MKNTVQSTTIYYLSFFILFISCENPSQNTQNNFDEEMQEIIGQIDEALATTQASVMKNKAEEATANLESKMDQMIDDLYAHQQETNNRQLRNSIVDIARIKAEIEVKLAFMDARANYSDSQQNLSYSDTTETSRTASGTATYQDEDDRSLPEDQITEDYSPVEPSIPDRPVTERPATDHTKTDQPEPDPRLLDTLKSGEVIVDDPILHEDLVSEIKNDLQELRRELEQFMQARL